MGSGIEESESIECESIESESKYEVVKGCKECVLRWLLNMSENDRMLFRR